MKKIALNPVREQGFDSKAQMRFLLQRAREYPNEYSWVIDALKEHGVPESEGPLHTYWTGPYNKSPDTPSYIYTGRKSNMQIEKLIKIAQQFDDLGNSETAKKLDTVAIKNVMVDEDAARSAVNAFWLIRKNEIEVNNPEKLAQLFHTFLKFEGYKKLPNEETKEEAKKMLGDKILGRV